MMKHPAFAVRSLPLRHCLTLLASILTAVSSLAQSQLLNLDLPASQTRYDSYDEFTSGSPDYGKRWPATYGDGHVTLWRDGKFAAYSITIDDNNKPDFPYWQAAAETYDWEFTWFVIVHPYVWDVYNDQPGTNTSYNGTLSDWAQLASEGHDIQLHASTAMNSLTAAAYETELLLARDVLQNATGEPVICYAYPSGKITSNDGLHDYKAIVANHMLSARGTMGGMTSLHMADYAQTRSLGVNALDNGEPDWQFARYNDPRPFLYSQHRGWGVSLYHNITGSEAEVTATLDWIKAHDDEFWVAPYTQVAKYAQERDSAVLNISVVQPDRIEFSLSDSMDDTLYTEPLTVKLRVDATWTAIEATQSGAPIDAALVTHAGDVYAFVEAVPDQGTVIVTNGPSSPPPTAATYAAFDGVNNDYVSSGPSITASDSYRDATPNGAYYRYTDMNSSVGGAQSFDLSHGNTDGGVNAPAIYGAAVWRDNVRPDDTTQGWQSTLKWINNIWSLSADVLQVSIPADGFNLSPDEAFGALLFEVNPGAAEEVVAMRMQGQLGRAEGANFSAEFRWAVVSRGQLYVSDDTFDLTTSWSDAELLNATATQWAPWSPASVEELKFANMNFTSIVLDEITQAGVVYALSDSDSSSNSKFLLSQLILDTAYAPQYVWAPIEIKAAEELSDPLGGGEGEQHPRGYARSVSNPDFVYAGIDVGGSWHSADGGVSWIKNRDAGLYAHGFSSIVVDPTDPLKIYGHCYVPSSAGGDFSTALANQEGIYYSTDGGQSWELILSMPIPNLPSDRDYRIWRTLMTPVVGVNSTEWYTCVDGSGLWKITDPRNGTTPTAVQLVADASELLYYTTTTFSHNGAEYFVYGNSSGLFRREIVSGALGPEIDWQTPIITAPASGYEGGVTSVYINPTNPNEVWASRRWDRPYRTLNAMSGSATWTAMVGQKSNGDIQAWATWFTDDMVMAVTPYASAGHMLTVDDNGVSRTVPAAAFLSVQSAVYQLIWEGATPVWRRYTESNFMDADFAKRPTLLDYKKAPFGAHAGYGFNPGDADDVSAFGTSTFWKTDSGGDRVSGAPGWRQTGYGYTGFAVQVGSNGIFIDDDNIDEMWFPWNDVGIGRTSDGGVSFDPLGSFPRGTSSSAAPDQFFWGSSGNVVVNPDNPDMAVGVMGYYTGAKLKVALTTNGGQSWQVASTNPDHFMSSGMAGGGVYVRVPDALGVLQPRAYLGCLYSTSADGLGWDTLDAYADRDTRTGYEAPASGKLYAVFGASAGNGKQQPDTPTLYALRSDGAQELIRGEPDATKASGYAWHRLLKWPMNMKSLAGGGLAAVSPANPNIVFAGEKADSGQPQIGTEFGQLITRFDFTGKTDANNPVFDFASFLYAQADLPGVGNDQINIITDLAADPYDDRVVYVTTAAAGLPCVFKVTFEGNGVVTVDDLSGDLPLCGMYSVTYDPRGGGRLLVGGFSGTWERPLP